MPRLTFLLTLALATSILLLGPECGPAVDEAPAMPQPPWLDEGLLRRAEATLEGLDRQALVEQFIIAESAGYGGRLLHEWSAPAQVPEGELAPLTLLRASGFEEARRRSVPGISIGRSLACALAAGDPEAIAWLAERHMKDIERLHPDLVHDSPLSWAHELPGDLLEGDLDVASAWLWQLRAAATGSRTRDLERVTDTLDLAESALLRLRSQGIAVVHADTNVAYTVPTMPVVLRSTGADSTFQIGHRAEEWSRAAMLVAADPVATVDSILQLPGTSAEALRKAARVGVAYRLWRRSGRLAEHQDRSSVVTEARLGNTRQTLPDDLPDGPPELETSVDTARYLARLRESSLTALPTTRAPLLELPPRVHVVNASPFGQDALQSAVGIYTHYTWYEPACAPLPAPDSLAGAPVIALIGPQLAADSLARLSAYLDRVAPGTPVYAMVVGHPERLRAIDPVSVGGYLPEASPMDWQRLLALPFGGASAPGRLPKAVAPWPEGARRLIERTRLSPADPVLRPLDDFALDAIADIAREAIRGGATPGVQVAIVHDGELIFDQAFGRLAPGDRIVRPTDRYDLASLTKVLATTLALMRLAEEGQIDIDDPVSKYVDGLPRATGRLRLRQLLRHATGLRRDLPIAGELQAGGGRFQSINCRGRFCRKAIKRYTVPVAREVYYDRDAQSRLRAAAKAALPVKAHRYGDLNFFLLQQVVERVAGTGLDRYVDSVFYEPLGVGLEYRPVPPQGDSSIAAAIAPTENDWRWRRQRLRGFVHDEAAALLGGVAGHAGVFGSARDVAVVFEMLARGGDYGGRRYLHPETVRAFTDTDNGQARGLGFAKLERPGGSKRGPLPLYGHTGFTGTSVWTDPERDLTVVFASNRIYRGKDNWRLQRAKIRERILEQAYAAIRTE